MRLTLTQTKEETAGVHSFIFSPAETLSWKAGQFLHYVLHHEPTDTRGSDRWFTVASAPSEHHVMITTRLASEKGSSFKKALAALKVGEQIEISDIDGDFTIEDMDKEYVFIAGGIGVTPFRSILTELDKTGAMIKATLLYANRDEHIAYKDEFDALAAKYPSLTIKYFTGTRIDEAAIKEAVADLQSPLFYVSGPEPMVEAFGTMLKGMGVPKENLKQDWFPGYPAE